MKNNIMNRFRKTAFEYASRAHEGQFRKGNGEPYINHPIRVAKDCEDWTDGPQEYPSLEGENIPDIFYAAAILHDVIEDSDVDLYEFEALFGTTVTEIVKLLTRKSGQSYYDFIVKMSQHSDPDISKIALHIKISDIEDNLKDLEEGSLKDKYRFALNRIYSLLV